MIAFEGAGTIAIPILADMGKLSWRSWAGNFMPTTRITTSPEISRPASSRSST
jgi:hypothetical protein